MSTIGSKYTEGIYINSCLPDAFHFDNPNATQTSQNWDAISGKQGLNLGRSKFCAKKEQRKNLSTGYKFDPVNNCSNCDGVPEICSRQQCNTTIVDGKICGNNTWSMNNPDQTQCRLLEQNSASPVNPPCGGGGKRKSRKKKRKRKRLKLKKPETKRFGF